MFNQIYQNVKNYLKVVPGKVPKISEIVYGWLLSELNATRLSISFSSFVNQAKNGTQAKKEKRTGSLLMKIQSFINGRSRNFDCQFAKIEGKCTAGYMI